ncbi:disease resistance protein RUN1-like isoform X2 [Vitis riparia]|uniref:disease resistance protein RUN1-like isoform X2 n=1 Tax=Vitis riparia TaxID=96939 RepID=UPI00155AB003|nr:disease resistance protein RUN1-like isoform X2 [Vitis riparia]
MASSSTERPSSSSTFKFQWSYDVFLSFSGEDTRRTFTDHLYSALIRNNIGTFRDDEELPRGGEIKPELFRAIEESRIAIIIFSKNYASSKWCLEELVKIMKCEEGKGQEKRSVIPIFYHVEPTEVRNQTGIYGDAFTHHVGNADEEKIREWRSALAKAGYLAGYEANKYRYESNLLDDIIKEIHRRLPKLLYVDQNIVGMNSHLEKLMSLLEIEPGHDRQRVSRILARFRHHAESGINGLLSRCLITISKMNTINMHGILAQMGKEKVDIEDRREPGNRSRLWRRKDIHRVLKKEKEMGTQKVEGIFLNEYRTKQMRFMGEAFQRMNRLKLLEVNHNRVQLFEDFAFPKDGLTYLYWDRYPLESLPSNFHMRNLVELNLKNSKIKQLWKENMLLKNLRRIDVSGSQQLTELPDISSVPNLEDLILSGCVRLGSLPGNIYELEHLLTLDCNDCSKLTSFPKIKCNIGKLGEPSSDETGLSLLSGLHSDQCNLTPGVIKSHNCLSSLKELSLRSCNLKEGEALNHIFHLSSLEVLNLSWFNSKEGGILSYIVERIGQLSNLRALYLSHCKKLPQIPELPLSLRLLDAHSLHGTSLPPMHSLVNCLKSANQDLKCKSSSNEVLLTGSEYTGHGICIVFPGSSGILEWIKNQKEGSSIRINLPQNWYENNDFLGVAICCVYVPLDECEYISENDSAYTSEMESDDGSAYESENESGDEPLNESEDLLEAESSFFAKLACQLEMDESVQDLRFGTTCKCYHFGGVSEQMWLIFYPKVAIQKSCGSNQFTSLTASFVGSYSNFKVIKCGLQPIYAQDPMVQTADVDVSCLECQRNEENRNLCFKGQTINQLPIEYPSEVETLCLRDCKNLESLPTSIWELKSLKSLVCSNCSQLQCFPESLENMGNLRELHLNGTAIKKLPSSIDYMNKLEVLNLESCQNLETLPESICNLCSLEVLHVSHCSKLHKWPQNLGTLKSLKLLYACGLNSTCCRLLSLSGLCSLKSLFLSQSKQMEGAILSDICCLYLLEVLDLCFCNIDEGGIPTEICYLSSLQQLLLMGNLFRSIPSGINQLSMLRLLDLSHCPELLQIPELPSSLRVLDVHECTRLDTSSGLLWSSLFKCFESVIQDLECGIYVREKCFRQGVSVIISGSSGIPKWISHHKKGAKVVAKLPQNWYKNNDFLGFVLYCVYDPLDNESEERLENDATYFKYGLTLRGHELQLVDGLSFYFSGNCCNAVPKMWMIYYPKVAIKKKYHSNKWGQLEASFCGYLHGKAMKVEECGIHLIYAHDHDQNHDKAMIPTICWKCQQDVQSQRQLCLKGNAINELPTTGCRLKLDSLCLWECKICTSLPSSSICELKSLTALFCSGSSQLRSFPEILQDLENLRELHLEGTAIEELPATIQHLKGLQCLCLWECKSLKSLPSSICELKSLTILFCSGCSQLNSFPEILVDVENLRQLHLDGTAIEELPASIQHLKGLQYLNLKDCYKLVSLPESICNLSSLKFLNVSFCTKLEKFPENLRSLQCLEALSASGLNLSMHYFSSIPAGIIQLSKLRVFDLSHCQRLLQVPELPASLRVLEVHSCSCLETLSSPSSLLDFSLLKCFKSTIEEFECGSYWNKAIRVVISGNNGIPEWISQQKKGSQITIELPMDWYRNNDFLGFALYSVFIPMVYDGLNCELNFCGDQSECCHVDDVWFLCCQICGESSQMCVTYYPKVAIDNQYWSNKWRRLKASFHGFDGKPVEVKECGFHLIYTPNVISKNIPQHTNTDAQRSCDNTEATKHNHQKMIEYNDEQRSCDTRSAAEETNTNAQTSYHYSQCTELSDSAMDTTTQNINSDVDAQDDEEDHMHNWLELLCKFVQWICCRRY